MVIMTLGLAGGVAGWISVSLAGLSSPALDWVFALNLLFQPTMFLIVWRRWLPPRVIDITCILFAAVLCAACMLLRLYVPKYGGNIDLRPLYLWIPVIYVLVFTLLDHKTSLPLALMILAAFVLISLPYLVMHIDAPDGNFTLQLHMVSAVLIAALHFFSSYQQRFQAVQMTVDELARLANTDELTGLANRRRMGEVLASELIRFARYGHAFSVILVDVDHFKRVNDELGHSTGDRTLIALAERVQSVLRDVDSLGRWGGEEFVVVLPETPFDETLQKAAELCTQVAARPLVGHHLVTVSCGVASVAVDDTVENLLQRADTALYAAKQAGRNRAEGRSAPTVAASEQLPPPM